MKIGERQRLLMRLLPRLIDKAHELGYELTIGDGYRDPRTYGLPGEAIGYGQRWSNHKLRLAIDLNLFRDGQYLTASDDHKPLGEFWESLHPECRWGGRFSDGNHYEVKPPR
jgi:hypothetical protein